MRVVPAAGETTWSFLHRVAAAYRLQVTDLAEWWRWTSPLRLKDRGRPDGEVLLDSVAQGQLAGWCRVPEAHLARALPSWQAGPDALDGQDDRGVGRARWRVGPLPWGPVAFGCRACAARRGAHGRPVWVYRPAWRRWCAAHGRWLLTVGEGHPLEFAEVTAMTAELGRAQRRWGRVEAAAQAAGVRPREVFALARAVVCGWWQREEFWAREKAWGPRLEQVAAATARTAGHPQGWGDEQWRLLVREMVVFPELVLVAQALLDPRLQALAAGLVRGGGRSRVVAALGERLGRNWLSETDVQAGSGALASWAQAVIRRRRTAAEPRSRQGRYGMWWVPMAHRPVELGPGLRQPAGPGGDDAGGHERAGEADAGAGRAELTVPRRVGPGRGLEQWREELFTQGLEQARRHVEQFGHLALPHTDGRGGDGFDLGRWLANRRAQAASLTSEQAAQLHRLDAWWNPPWPVDWQRAWYRARTHVRAHGTVTGGDNLDGLPRWLERWLRHQITHYPQLHPNQRRLLGHLGLTESEVARFHTWPHRRRPAADGLAAARAHAGRHGHLALSRPTDFDGFPLGTWLAHARTRQRQAGRPTRLGAQLSTLDAWWDPPWPIAWQRTWWACRHHQRGLPDGMTWWPGAPGADHADAWLTQQAARRPLLHPGQQDLIDELTALSDHTPGWQPRISDQAWTILSALLTPLPHHGGRRRSQRQLLEAILHITCTHQPWTQLPHALGPFQTCLRRYHRWLSDGTLTRITHTPLPETDRHWQTALTHHLDQAANSR
ncbi:Helicase associated domain protein [Streptomyces sp. 7R007]